MTASRVMFFFFNDTATTEIYTLSLHDALPIYYEQNLALANTLAHSRSLLHVHEDFMRRLEKAGVLNREVEGLPSPDRKSTRLNSSHANISYAVFCLKKKKQISTLLALLTHSAI